MDAVAVETAPYPVLSFLAITAMAGFVVFMTGFRLVGRAAESTPEGRVGWTFLGAVAGCSGLWMAAVLPTVGLAGDHEHERSEGRCGGGSTASRGCASSSGAAR